MSWMAQHESHHWRCVNAALRSFDLLNGVVGGTPRAASVVPGPGGPTPPLMPLLALIPVPVPPFVLRKGNGDGDDVGGFRSSTGGKRSLSISDLRLRTEQSPIFEECQDKR
jgi:hypothetical protein